MTRATVLFVSFVLAATAARAGDVAEGILPPRERIEKPYTDDKCLDKCHGLPGFSAGSELGYVRDLHVDPEQTKLSMHAQKGVECIDCHYGADPNTHPRIGYPDVDCRACHSEKPPEGVFPPDALQRLEAKGIKPPPKESQNAEKWAKTEHGKEWAEGNPAAPFCNHCHTAHYVRKAEDAASAVHRDNLAETCGACHVDQVRSYDVGGLLARFRIGAHGKGDLSNRYDVSQCTSCHQGQAAHGEETVTGQACPSCHQVPESEAEGKELATLHIKPAAADQPLARGFGWAYRVLVWGGVAGAALFVLFLGFSTLYRKHDEPGS